MKVLRLGDSGSQSGGEPEYIHDSQPGDPIAIFWKIDEAALKDAASRVGIDYVHSPDKFAIELAARSMFDKASTLAESRKPERHVPLHHLAFRASTRGPRVEGAAALRAQQLRNSHAIELARMKQTSFPFGAPGRSCRPSVRAKLTNARRVSRRSSATFRGRCACCGTQSRSSSLC